MSPARSDGAWPGCHGVRVEGATIAIGAFHGIPLASATVRYGDVDLPDGEQLWSQNGEAAAMFRRPDGRLVLAGPNAAALEFDPRDGSVTIAPGDDAVQRQLVASFGLPLLLHGLDVLLVHGSSCARDGKAIVVCADSGSGKSSVLVRLVDEGWSSLSEDVVTIDLRGDKAQVWPGPPWVRVAHGEPGPRDMACAFESADKTAWDVSAVQATGPVELERVVLLEAPGGDAPALDAMSRADALRALARHAVWLQDPDDRGRELFGRVAKLLTKAPAVRLRLPRRDEWRDSVPEMVTAGTFST
ncbi:MAG: hypothetical protein QOG90_1158 [Actinomycetota bacterium]|jgi:hypothetical protein